MNIFLVYSLLSRLSTLRSSLFYLLFYRRLPPPSPPLHHHNRHHRADQWRGIELLARIMLIQTTTFVNVNVINIAYPNI